MTWQPAASAEPTLSAAQLDARIRLTTFMNTMQRREAAPASQGPVGPQVMPASPHHWVCTGCDRIAYASEASYDHIGVTRAGPG